MEAEREHVHLPAHIQHELQYKMSGSFQGDDGWMDSHKRFKTAAAKVPYEEVPSSHLEEHADEGDDEDPKATSRKPLPTKREWELSQFIALQQALPYNFTETVGPEGWAKQYMPSHEPEQLSWLAVCLLDVFHSNHA